MDFRYFFFYKIQPIGPYNILTNSFFFCFAIGIFVENNFGGYPLLLLNFDIIKATDTVFFFQSAYPFDDFIVFLMSPFLFQAFVYPVYTFLKLFKSPVKD